MLALQLTSNVIKDYGYAQAVVQPCIFQESQVNVAILGSILILVCPDIYATVMTHLSMKSHSLYLVKYCQKNLT